MSPMLSATIFSFLLVMAVGASGEGAIVSDSATATAYWQTMLPNTPMPPAILELLPHNSAEVGNDGESHGDVIVAFFLEEALTPGSTVTPNIPPTSTSGALLLRRRDAAASIPMSTEKFTDVMKMSAPVSRTMANDIWSTLDICENLLPVKDEKKTCVTSLESMVEYVASILTTGGDTRNLRSFSSPDVPMEGVVSSGRNKYKVSASRRATELSESATCHGMRFPYPVFMCHALNPTRVYTVTLEKTQEDVGGGPERMEVLAVCHLDTSGFEPEEMPAHVKPGDAPICHFIARDGIIWAPATPSVPAA